MDAVHRAAGGCCINLVHVVNICCAFCSTRAVGQAIQIDYDELFLLLGPVCIDCLRIRAVRKRFPCVELGVELALTLVRQNKYACAGFACAFRDIRGKGAGFAVSQRYGFRVLAGVQRFVRVCRVDVGANGQCIGFLRRAIRCSDLNSDLLVAVIQINAYIAVG